MHRFITTLYKKELGRFYMAFTKAPPNYIENCKKAREARSNNKKKDSERMKPISVSLSSAHALYLSERGNGNISKAIRNIVDELIEEEEMFLIR